MRMLLLLFSVIAAMNTGAQTPQLTLPIGHGGLVLQASYSPDGKSVLSSGQGSRIFLWEAAGGRLIKSFAEEGFRDLHAFFSPDGKYIAARSFDALQSLAIWNITSGRCVLRAASQLREGANFPLPGIAVYYDEDSVHVAQLATGGSRSYPRAFSSSIHLNGTTLTYIASSGRQLELRRVDIRTGKPINTIRLPENYTVPASNGIQIQMELFEFAPDGKTLLYKTPERYIFFETATGRELLHFEPSGFMEEGQAFSSDGAFYVCVQPERRGGDRIPIKIIDIRTGRLRELPNSEDSARWAAHTFSLAGIADTVLYLEQKSRGINNGGLHYITHIKELNLHTGKRKTIYYEPGKLERLVVAPGLLLMDLELEQHEGAVLTERYDESPREALVLHRGTHQVITRLPGRIPFASGKQLAGSRFLYIGPGRNMPMQQDLAACRSTAFMGRNEAGGPLAFTNDGRLFTGNKLLDLETGTALHAFSGNLEDWSATHALVLTRPLPDSSFTLYHLSTGKQIAQLPRGALKSNIDQDAFVIVETGDSVTSAHSITGTKKHYAGSYYAHYNRQKLLITLVASSRPVAKGWSYNDKNARSKDADSEPYQPGLLRLFDMESGRKLLQLEGEAKDIVLDTYGHLLYVVVHRTDSAELNSTVLVYHAPTGTVKRFTGWFESFSRSRVLKVSSDNVNTFFQLPAGNALNEEPEETYVSIQNKRASWEQEGLLRFVKNSDSSFYAGWFRDSTVQIRSADSSYHSPRIRTGSGYAGKLLFELSPDRRWALLALADSNYLFDLSGKMPTRSFTLQAGEFVQAIRFRQTNFFEIIIERPGQGGYSFNSETVLWNALELLPLLRVNSHLDGNVFTYSPNSRFAAFRNEGMIGLYDLNARRFLYQYLNTDSLNGLVFDSALHYDGPEQARNTMHLTCGTEIIELAQVKDELWQPNLAARLLRGERINGPTLNDLDICGLTPVVEDRSTGSIFRFRVQPRRGGIGETILYVNGIEVRRYPPSTLRRAGTDYELLLTRAELEPYFAAGQENLVAVKAYTKDNGLQSRGIIASTQGSASGAAPRLFAVMVGVSDYKGESLDLKYAAKDAADLSAVLALAARKLLNTPSKDNVFVYNLNTGSSRDAFPDKENIRLAFADIASKAGPNDVLFVFFAGHGVTQGEKKQFYFLTADAGSASHIEKSGISISELNSWTRPDKIKAQKRILIFDACNSGQAINDLVTVGEKTDGYLAARNNDESNRIKAVEKLRERAGMFILSAAASNQFAYELGRYEQGVLTYALLRTIREQPAILEGGQLLNVDRWFSATEQLVTDIVNASGNRQHPQKFGTGVFNIGIIDTEVIGRIQLPSEKPLFTSSSFLPRNGLYDSIRLSRFVNRQLTDISARGLGSTVAFLSESDSPDALQLSGRYEVEGSELLVQVAVVQGDRELFRFVSRGSLSGLSQLAAQLVQEAERRLKNQ